MIASPVSRLSAVVLAAVALTVPGTARAQTAAHGVLSLEPPAVESPTADRPAAQTAPTPARPLMLLPPKMPETPAGNETNPNPPILRPNFADTAPLPTPPSGVAPMAVEMDMLRSIDPDSAGTLDPQQGGFAYSMWQGTPRGVIEALIPRLPVDVRSGTARALIRRLLTTAAGVPAPADKANSGAVIGARARQLAAMGAGMAVLDLLDATPARETVPALARIEARVRLGENDLRGACKVVAANFERDSDPFWQKTMVLCQALEGEREKASLGLALLREMGNDDPAYFTLMDGLVNGVPVVLERMPDPSPLTLAVARGGQGAVAGRCGLRRPARHPADRRDQSVRRHRDSARGGGTRRIGGCVGCRNPAPHLCQRRIRRDRTGQPDLDRRTGARVAGPGAPLSNGFGPGRADGTRRR